MATQRRRSPFITYRPQVALVEKTCPHVPPNCSLPFASRRFGRSGCFARDSSCNPGYDLSFLSRRHTAYCFDQKSHHWELLIDFHFSNPAGRFFSSKFTQNLRTASRLRDADFFCPASTVAFLNAEFFLRWARSSRSSVFDRALKYSVPFLASAAQALSQPDMNGTPAIQAL